MESYLVEKEKLKKEYRECFERVEAYAFLKNIDEKTQEEMMMNLVDVLYTAQRKGKPLEKIVGKDIEAFCKNYFSEYHSVIQWIKGFPKWIYRSSCLLLFFCLFEIGVLWEEKDFHLLTATTDVSGYMGGIILGLIFALLSNYIGQHLIFRVKRVNATAVSVISVVVLLVCMIPAAVLFADKVVAVPLLPITILCVVYCSGYKIMELRTRHRKFGTLKKPVELQKNFEKKNQKLRKRGKAELTIEKYMKKLQGECQMVKICDWIIRLFFVGILLIAVTSLWMDHGITTVLIGGSVLTALYYGIYKMIMNNEFYEARENYLKQSEKEGITILELAERVEETNREETE